MTKNTQSLKCLRGMTRQSVASVAHIPKGGASGKYCRFHVLRPNVQSGARTSLGAAAVILRVGVVTWNDLQRQDALTPSSTRSALIPPAWGQAVHARLRVYTFQRERTFV